MTTTELLEYEINGIGAQLRAVLKDMPEALQDQKLSAAAMTPREMAEHMAEAYHAVILDQKGEKHEWGSYSIDDKSWGNLLEVLWKTRETASRAVCKDNEAALKAGFDYIVAHDGYHVGQLAALRIQQDSDWDPYSIYGE